MSAGHPSNTSGTHSHPSNTNNMSNTSNVSLLLATTREEVKSREGGSNQTQQQQRGSQSARGAKPKAKLSASISRGNSKLFFANAPLFTIPPVSTNPPPLFHKINSNTSMRTSQASMQQQSQAAFARNHSNASLAHGDPEEALYSPDMPQLVPYRPTDLQGPLPPTVFQKPFSSIAAQGSYAPGQGQAQGAPPTLAGGQYPQQRASQSRLNHTAPGPLQPVSYPPLPPQSGVAPQSLLPGQPNPAYSVASNHARLARTYVPPGGQSNPNVSSQRSLHLASTGSLSGGGFAPTVPQPILPPQNGRLELLEYLSSPQCSLFTTQVQVLGTELDSMLSLCGGLQPALNVLQALDTKGVKVVHFSLLLELVRSRLQGNPAETLQHSGSSKVITRAVGQPIGGQYEEKSNLGQPPQQPFGGPYNFNSASSEALFLPKPPSASSGTRAGGKQLSRKQLALLANGGVEAPAETESEKMAEQERTVKDIVAFISSPACILFPEPPAASGPAATNQQSNSPSATTAPEEPDIKIESRDLYALVGLASRKVVLGYLHALNRQLGENQQQLQQHQSSTTNLGQTPQRHPAGQSTHHQALVGGLTLPFRSFAQLLSTVTTHHSRALKAKNAVKEHLNHDSCKLFVRKIVPEESSATIQPTASIIGSKKTSRANLYHAPSTKSLASNTSSTKDLSASSSSQPAQPAHQNPPRFTLYDMDRMWLELELSTTGEELLSGVKTLESEGVKITKRPFLQQLTELLRAQVNKRKGISTAQQQQGSAQPPSTTAAATGDATGRKKKRLGGEKGLQSHSSSHLSDVDSSATGASSQAQQQGSSGTGGSIDPASTFSALTKRAQRFVVELTAFFRSPKCRVFVPVEPAAAGSDSQQPSSPPFGSAASKYKHPLIESITNDDLVALMRVAGETELFETEIPAGRRSSTGLDFSGESSSARQLVAQTNRALFFLTAINIAITLPRPTMQPVKDWESLLQAVQLSHEQSLLVQSHLLDRLTNAHCKLFSHMQIRRVPDSYSGGSGVGGGSGTGAPYDLLRSPSTLTDGGVEDDGMSSSGRDLEEESLTDGNGTGGRSRSRSVLTQEDKITASATSINSDGTGVGTIATAGATADGSEEQAPFSERLLYISSFDMHRLFFESTAGMYVESYLDSFESAQPQPKTFFDFNGLVFGVKVAHLLWLSQQKQEREALDSPTPAASEKESKKKSAAKTVKKSAQVLLSSSPSRAALTEADASQAGNVLSQEDAQDLLAYKQVALNSVGSGSGVGTEVSPSPASSSPPSSAPSSDVPTQSGRKTKGVNAATQTPLSSAPLLSKGIGNEDDSQTSSNKPVPSSQQKILPKDAEEQARISLAMREAQHQMSLSELGVHLRSTTVQSLLFDPTVLPLTISEDDLVSVLESAKDLDLHLEREEQEWSDREWKEKLKEYEKEVAVCQASGKQPPPPLERPIKQKETDPMILATQAAAAQSTAQAQERAKCALILSFLHQLEAPALTASAQQGVKMTGSTFLGPIPGHAPAQVQPTTVASGESEFARSVPFPEGSSRGSSASLIAAAQAAEPTTPMKFHSIAQLCDALYLEYALHRNKEDTLAFLRSPSCRLLPEGSAPIHTTKDLSGSTSAASLASSKLQNMLTGGPHGTINSSDVAALYKYSKAGLYTLPILHELNNEHLRAFDLDSLISMVAGNHSISIARIKAQKFLLLTHLSGNLCRIFPKPVRVTDAHLDLLLTSTRNSAASALYYLHQLSLHDRSFSSMDEVISAVKYMLSHPNPFKNRLKQLLSSPMCIVMNKQPVGKERTAPTDSVIDRLWDVQQAGIDALTHIQALHADAQGFSNYVELVTAVAANQASARSSLQEADKLCIMAHLASPLNGLFSYPLYDITITPKHLEQLLAAGGGSASVVLFHLEHLDVEGVGRGAYDGMPPLIAKVQEAHASVRAQDEKLQVFLNSRVCRIFRDAAPGAIPTPWDETAVEKLLNEGGITAPATYQMLQDFNHSDPPRSFKTVAELVHAIQVASKADPRIQGRSRNSLNNFGQPKDNSDTQALPQADPVRLSFPGSSAKNSGLIVDTPLVNGLFYSDGSMALDAEEGIPGKFVVDPSQLYDDPSSPQQGPYNGSRPGSGRIRMSRPASPSTNRSPMPPPPTDPAALAQLEKDREMIVDYLNERCSLFRDVDLEVTVEHLDETIHIAGGAKNVVLELTRMDAMGVLSFRSFEELLLHLREACHATKAMEKALLTYRHPDEEHGGDGSSDDPNANVILTPDGLEGTLPESVRQASVAAQDMLVVNPNMESESSSGPPSLTRKTSVEQQNNLQRALAIATSLANGEEMGPDYRYTDEDREKLREAVRASDVLRDAQVAAGISADLAGGMSVVTTNQILIIGGGLDHSIVHLKRFGMAKRQFASASEIAQALEEAKSSGIYASPSDMSVVEAFLAIPKNAYLKCFFNSTAIEANFRDLPRNELDLWLRSCGGSTELIRMLTYLAKYNRMVSKMTSGKLDQNGLTQQPSLLVPKSPEHLKELYNELSSESQKEALAYRKQARVVIQSFLTSESCAIWPPSVTEENMQCTSDQADAILDALSPNNVARSEPVRYKPTESDVEVVLERINRFDLVGRKFPSVQALLEACKVATATSSGADTRDNLAGAWCSKTQRRVLGNYLSSDSCGLMPIDARRKFEALTPADIDELLIALTHAARVHQLHPLSFAKGPSLPRYISPLHRLQMRSPSAGEEYKTVDDVLRGLNALATEAPLQQQHVAAAVAYLTSEETNLFSDVPHDAGLEIDETDVIDMIRLLTDWPTAHTTLQKLDACGVKVPSVRALQHQLQRCLSFGLFATSRDRTTLMEWLLSNQNTVLTIPRSKSFSDAELDSLLLYSQSRGARGLIDVVFRGLAADYPEKAKDVAELVARCEAAVQAQAAVATTKTKGMSSRTASNVAILPELPLAAQPAQAQDAVPSAIPAAGGESTETTTPAPAQPSTPSSLTPVEQFKLSGVIKHITSPQCTLYSEALRELEVPKPWLIRLIREAEVVQPDDAFTDAELSPEQRANVTVYFLQEFERTFLKVNSIQETSDAIREARRSGSMVSAGTKQRIVTLLLESTIVPIAPQGSEFDSLIRECDGFTGLTSIVESLQKQSKRFESVRELIAHITSQRQAVSSSTAATSFSDSDRTALASALNGLLPPAQIPGITDAVYLSWIQECAGLDAVLQRLALFLRVERHFASSSEILPALVEVQHTGLAVSAELKQAFVEFIHNPESHLFSAPDGESPSTHSVLASATGTDVTDLFIVGQGLNNLLAKLSYLDTIGARFQSVAELKPALEPLKDLMQPTEDDRARLVEFLGSSDCGMFDLSSESSEMEITSSQIDAMIIIKQGIDACLAGLRSLEADGWRVQKLDQMILLLLGKPAPGAIRLATPSVQATPASPTSATGEADVAPPSVGSSIVGDEPAHPSHDAILEYLSRDDVVLFAPLADSAAELEVRDIDLDDMISSTSNSVEKTLKVLAELNRQQKGFHSLHELAETVTTEFARMQAAGEI